MTRIDVSALNWNRASYPEPFATSVAGRSWQSLGDAAGLTQFGVNLMRIEPGGASAARHWHEAEDEFVYMIDGELVLIDNDGETVMRAGDAAGFKAGLASGHHLVNRSDREAVFLVVGSRAPRERCHYPDIDLAYEYDNGRFRYTRKSGEPFGDWQHE
jgi:uncharacterized cupin superfamily protein